MVGCSAPNCSNRATKDGFKMKRFPADPAIRQIWINNVRRADWNWNPPANFRNCRICEVHFDEEQFEYKSPDSVFRRFKAGAIPTVFNVSPGPEGQPGAPSFEAYSSRRRKKIVGDYDPSLCAANLNQMNQRLSSLQKPPSNIGDGTTAPSQDPLLDRRNPNGNLPSSSLSVGTYMTDHPDFSRSSNQIPYNYHKRFEDSRATMPLVFHHSREIDAIHLPSIPISTAERFNIFPSMAGSSRTSGVSDPDLTADNIQRMLEPGEIKLEYITDSPASEDEASSDKIMSIKPLLIKKHGEQNIQTTTLQDMPQTVIHEKFRNPPSATQPLLSMAHRERESHTQHDLSQNIKVDYDFAVSALDSGSSDHYPELATNHLQSTPEILVATSTSSVIPPMSVPIKKDLSILPNSSELSHEDGNQRLISIEKKLTREKSQTPTMPEDVMSNTNSKHVSNKLISSGSRFSMSPNENYASLLTKRNVIISKSIQQQSGCGHTTEEQSDVEILEVDPSSHSISYSASSGKQQKRDNVQPTTGKKDGLTRGRKRLHSKRFLADCLQKKLIREKQKSRQLRLENQKLRKQLGPLRSLRHWISKFMGSDQIKQLENLETKETSFKALRKSLKMCSIVCGYLSTVVSFPFYSTKTRPV